MSGTYDIYKKNENEEPIWVETVVGLHQVKKGLMKLTALKAGTYLIYDPTKAQFVEPFKKSA
jgi:hypothetical protein